MLSVLLLHPDGKARKHLSGTIRTYSLSLNYYRVQLHIFLLILRTIIFYFYQFTGKNKVNYILFKYISDG